MEVILPELLTAELVRMFFTVVVWFIYAVIALGLLAFAASEM